jgi:hypothetical protein
VIGVVVALSAWYIDYSRAQIEMAVHERIVATTEHIMSLALVTDRNGADELTERIVSDCPRRTEFENLLNMLNTATRKDLISAQQLFESCGSFYAERKALMVAQLEREYTLLENDLALLNILRDLTPEEEALRTWKEIVELEIMRSSLLSEQTALQADIIRLLIEGSASSRIQELVRQAQELGQSLSVTDAQIDALRTNIAS